MKRTMRADVDVRRRYRSMSAECCQYVILLAVMLYSCCVGKTTTEISVDSIESTHTGYACEGSELQIRCSGGTRIKVLNANYGRLVRDICNDRGSTESWNLQCISSVSLRVVRDRCDGMTSNCSIESANWLFGDPCVNTPKYLTVLYQCRRGDFTTRQTTPTTESSSATTSLQPTQSVDSDESLTTSEMHFSVETTPEVSRQAVEEDAREFCQPTTVRGVSWPRTVAGTTVEQKCPSKDRNRIENGPIAVWHCSRTRGNANWVGQPDFSRCVSDATASLQASFLATTNGNLSVSSVNGLLDELVSVTSQNDDDLYGGDLEALMSILSVTVSKSASILLPTVSDKSTAVALTANISQAVLTAGSSLLSDQKSQIWNDLGDSSQTEAASQLIEAVEMSAFMRANVDNQPRNVVIKDYENIAMEINVIDPSQESQDVVFPNLNDDDEDDNWKNYFGSIKIRQSTIKDAAGADGVTRIVFAGYNNLDRWLKSNPNSTTGEWNVNTKIISAAINSRGQSSDQKKLNVPVEFTLEHNENTNQSEGRCAYWEFPVQGRRGYWSTAGCRVIGSNSSHTVCSCDHLTNFAVLMSVSGHEELEIHEFSLSLITYFGCIISLVCLILAFLTFLVFKNLQCDRNTIHKNLVLCLFIAESIFLIGIHQHEIPLLCSVIAGFLHYFFLAAFGWMLMEGVQLYAMLVEVFEAERSRVMWYYAGGYGLPAVIVIISASVYPAGYGTAEYCWLTVERDFKWAFVGPAIAILAVNTVMLFIALYTMCRHSRTNASWQVKQKSHLENIALWLKGSFVLIVLLGLTWLFGVFYLGQQSVFMAYVFTLFNSLQGLFIFVFHCLLSEKVQKEYRKWVQRTSWLPDVVRQKYGTSGSAGGSTGHHIQSTSAPAGGNYFAKLWGSRKQKKLSSSSTRKLQTTGNKDGAEKVLIVISAPDDLVRSEKKNALQTPSRISESARLTDSTSSDCNGGRICGGGDQRNNLFAGGWESSNSFADGNTEDPSGYLENSLTRVDEAYFDGGRALDDSISDIDCSVGGYNYLQPQHQQLQTTSNGDTARDVRLCKV